MSKKQRRARPRRSGRRRTPSRSRWQRFLIRYGWLLPVGAILIGGAVLLVTYAFASIPLPKDIDLASSAQVYDVHGELIGTYSDEVTRFLIDTDKLPAYVGQAVVAAEDRDFYEHNGVSPRAIARAAWANLTGGRIEQGGSTITQQYVKNAVLEDPERTVTRKIKEAILAIKLERRYAKDQILGFYLNTIYLGRGAYGVEAAARAYFDKNAVDLTLAEAAFLAGIIPAPESYQPDEHARSARERRDFVLERMAEEGYIDPRRAERASRGRVKLSEGAEASVRPQPAAYFLEWLRKEYLYPEFGNDLFTRGLQIHTTLDLDLQEAAETAVATQFTDKEDPQAALVSMTARGEVRAFVGGRAFTSVAKARGFNYASDFPGRSAGSSFKPFTLLTAVEEDISPQSRFSGGSPVTITDPECADPEEGLWQPENFGGSQYGTITLEQATTNSVNTVYAQLAAEVGPDKIVDTLEELGFDRNGQREIEAVCSLALGILDVTPVEMARAYAAFAARGALPEVSPITFVEDSNGGCVREYRATEEECEEVVEPEVDQVFPKNSLDVVNQTLTHVVEEGTATAADIERPVAGKTGTTQNHENAWFAGYVPQMATVVWVGYPLDPGQRRCDESCTPRQQTRARADDFIPRMEYCTDTELCRPVAGPDGVPISVTGGSFPARIWAQYMRVATANMNVVEFPIPEDVPDEVINSPAPAPTRTQRPTPSPSAIPSASPSEIASPSPAPTQSPEPPIIPTPSPSGPEGET
ncbi:MAG TPA: transglycosylase domain-containing protein [Actinomycetota bacterium]|nr:transglycosylase domain-containing protein [Actinomycetota bacterium]